MYDNNYYVAPCDLKLLPHNSLAIAIFDYRPETLLVVVKKLQVLL